MAASVTPSPQTEDVNSEFSTEEERDKLAYCVTDVPPWYLCIILGIQVKPTNVLGVLPCPSRITLTS